MLARVTISAALLTLATLCPVHAQQPELIAVIKSDTINTRFGFRIMPLGDQNGDGRDDIMVCDVLGRAYYFRGSSEADTISSYELRFDEITNRMNNMGDLSDDGYDDFTLPRYVAGKGKLDLYYGGPTMDTVPDRWFGMDSTYGRGFSGVGVVWADLPGDLIASYGDDGGSVLFYSYSADKDSVHHTLLRPANLSGSEFSTFGSIPAIGHFNEDTHLDLALGLKRRQSSLIPGSIHLYWGGGAFDTLPDMIIDRPQPFIGGGERFAGMLLECPGDLNGDGFDDLFASATPSDDSLGFIFFGGPELDSIPEVVITQPHNVARAAGDLNHDGYDDLILGYGLDLWFIGGVYVFYGGPDMDSIPDIVITNEDTPGYQTDFGLDVSGVGDFNGDGLNDFAFPFKDAIGEQFVLVYSGTDVNSVDYTYDPTLPDGFTLSHNFPNPFNPYTTIEFAIPVRSRVMLTIYDILGREVRRLTEGTLSAGSYLVEWDGRSEAGQTVSSEVYFYRLQVGETNLTRKMVLLK